MKFCHGTFSVPTLIRDTVRGAAAASVVWLLSFILLTPAYAAECGLDLGFGSNGKVITPTFRRSVEDMAVQEDGKIVVVGFDVPCVSCSTHFMVSRYNSDGSIDTTFGSGGSVVTQVSQFDIGRAVAIQPDGKIIVAGDVYKSHPFSVKNFDAALVRYNQDGSIDTTFGTNGVVTTDFALDDSAEDVALQGDGKIVIAGVSYTSDVTGATDAIMARYNSDGSLDSTFGSGGKVITDFFGDYDELDSIVIQPDGKIIAGGTTAIFETAPFDSDFALARYNSDGSLDSTFGSGGRVTTDFGNLAGIATLARQPDGKVIAIGGMETPQGIVPANDDIAMARYNSDGSLDSTFGSGGKVTADFGGNESIWGALQLDGKIVVAGVLTDHNYTSSHLLMARFNSSGSLDLSFCGGEFTTDFGDISAGATAIALQPDGKILVAGNSNANSSNSVLLARYSASPAPSIPPASAATIAGTAGSSGWYQSDVNVAISATDHSGSGIQSITYQLDSDPPVTVAADATSFVLTRDGQTAISYFAKDSTGNTEAPHQLTVRIDKHAPAISCGTADASWHASNVSIRCTAQDVTSGLADSSDAMFSLATSVPNGAETNDAVTGSRVVCDAAGNCSNAGPVGGNKIDRKAPTVSLSAPVSGTYMINERVAAGYACSDGGSGVTTCSGAVANGDRIDTSTAGIRNFTVSSTDVVGNVAAPTSVSYGVAYGVSLLYDPTKSAKAGSPIPIKVELVDANGVDVSSSAVVLHALGVVQVTTDASEILAYSGNSNPDFNFRYDPTLGGAGGYIFNLSTKGYPTGTFLLSFTAGEDPTAHSVQFQVRQ